MSFFDFFRNDSNQPSSNSYEVDFIHKSGIGSYSKLVFKLNGWFIWEVSTRGLIGFVALKSAEKSELPKMPESANFIFGGTGFYMNYICLSGIENKPYFSFYGKYPFRQSTICEIDNKIIDSFNENGILEINNKNISYEVISCLDKRPNKKGTNIYKDTGVVKLNDFDIIYSEMTRRFK